MSDRDRIDIKITLANGATAHLTITQTDLTHKEIQENKQCSTASNAGHAHI